VSERSTQGRVWSALPLDEGTHTVARTPVGIYHVLTVRTRVAPNVYWSYRARVGDGRCQRLERYETEDDAREGHERWVDVTRVVRRFEHARMVAILVLLAAGLYFASLYATPAQ
jgi:hypothetical protein